MYLFLISVDNKSPVCFLDGLDVILNSVSTASFVKSGEEVSVSVETLGIFIGAVNIPAAVAPACNMALNVWLRNSRVASTSTG